MNFLTQIQKEVLPLLKMTKIGIIAGDGNLPLYIGKSLLSKNYDVTFLSLNIKNINELLELLDDLNYRLKRVKTFNSSLEFEIFQFLNRFHWISGIF